MTVPLEPTEGPPDGRLSPSLLEREIDALYSTVPVAFARVDGELRCLRVSRRWRDIAGLPPETPAGLGLADAFPALHPWLSEQVRTAQTSTGPVTAEPPAVGGHPAIRQATCSPLPDPEGGTATVAIVLAEAPAPADADRRWSEFLGLLVHDVRNVLSPIMTSTQLLRRHGAARPELLDSVSANVERQTRRMIAILDVIADFSRIGRGTLSARTEATVLGPPVNAALDSARPEIEKQGQRLAADLPKPFPIVLADPARLAQAIERVLAQASRLTPAGGTLSVDAFVDGEMACIRVRDSGGGLAPDQLARAFDPFVRAEPALHGGPADFGIDLPLARELVRVQGGDVRAFSAGKGLGAEYLISLPLAPRTEKS